MADDESQGPPHSGTRALRLALAAHERKVDDQVAGLKAELGEVAKAVTKLARVPTDPPPSWHWDDLDPADHDEQMELLERWVATVLRRWHPRAAVALRPCWARHPPAVAAVTAAWIAWEGAYRGEQRRSTDPAAWLRDWLPALTTQLNTELGEPRRGPTGELDLSDTDPCTQHTQESTS